MYLHQHHTRRCAACCNTCCHEHYRLVCTPEPKSGGDFCSCVDAFEGFGFICAVGVAAAVTLEARGDTGSRKTSPAIKAEATVMAETPKDKEEEETTAAAGPHTASATNSGRVIGKKPSGNETPGNETPDGGHDDAGATIADAKDIAVADDGGAGNAGGERAAARPSGNEPDVVAPHQTASATGQTTAEAAVGTAAAPSADTSEAARKVAPVTVAAGPPALAPSLNQAVPVSAIGSLIQV